jgi:hypothetical protein
MPGQVSPELIGGNDFCKKLERLESEGGWNLEWAGLLKMSADRLDLITQLHNPGGGRPFCGNQGNAPGQG